MSADDSKIIPFGKYKGRLVDELLVDDPSYLQWLAGQDWFRAKFNVLHQVIINRGAEPEETPEHNALQVKFLDDEFCQRFMQHYAGEYAYTCLQEILSNQVERTQYEIADQKRCLEHSWYSNEEKMKVREKLQRLECRLTEQLKCRVDKVEFKIKQSIEERGADIVLRVTAVNRLHDIATELWGLYPCRNTNVYAHRGVAIEIKPLVGDHYPAVLRQMKRTGSNVLFVSEYTGQGATEEQFVKTMATAGIRVVFARELES